MTAYHRPLPLTSALWTATIAATTTHPKPEAPAMPSTEALNQLEAAERAAERNGRLFRAIMDAVPVGRCDDLLQRVPPTPATGDLERLRALCTELGQVLDRLLGPKAL